MTPYEMVYKKKIDLTVSFVEKYPNVITFYWSDMVLLFSGQPTPTRSPTAPAPGKKKVPSSSLE